MNQQLPEYNPSFQSIIDAMQIERQKVDEKYAKTDRYKKEIMHKEAEVQQEFTSLILHEICPEKLITEMKRQAKIYGVLGLARRMKYSEATIRRWVTVGDPIPLFEANHMKLVDYFGEVILK